jgi:hypothetical protein
MATLVSYRCGWRRLRRRGRRPWQRMRPRRLRPRARRALVVEIALPNGCRLRVPADIEASSLHRLVTVLKTAT